MPEQPLHFVPSLTSGVLACAEHIDGQVLVHDRRQLSVPARRAAERSFPHELSSGRIQTAKAAFLKTSLRNQQAFLVVKRRGVGDVYPGEVLPPQQPARVLLDCEDLAPRRCACTSDPRHTWKRAWTVPSYRRIHLTLKGGAKA